MMTQRKEYTRGFHGTSTERAQPIIQDGFDSERPFSTSPVDSGKSSLYVAPFEDHPASYEISRSKAFKTANHFGSTRAILEAEHVHDDLLYVVFDLEYPVQLETVASYVEVPEKDLGVVAIKSIWLFNALSRELIDYRDGSTDPIDIDDNILNTDARIIQK